MMRRFVFQRDVDVSGFSGTGVVLEGVQWADGRVAGRWVTGQPRSTVIYESIEDAIAIHGHGGATRLVWIDEADKAALRRVAEAIRSLGHQRPSEELLSLVDPVYARLIRELWAMDALDALEAGR